MSYTFTLDDKQFSRYDSLETVAPGSAWEDDDLNDGEWPYPTRYLESEAQGELADRIRAKLGLEPGTVIILRERIESGGYSEYTIEDYSFLDIDWPGGTINILDDSSRSSVAGLIDWLDATN